MDNPPRNHDAGQNPNIKKQKPIFPLALLFGISIATMLLTYNLLTSKSISINDIVMKFITNIAIYFVIGYFLIWMSRDKTRRIILFVLLGLGCLASIAFFNQTWSSIANRDQSPISVYPSRQPTINIIITKQPVTQSQCMWYLKSGALRAKLVAGATEILTLTERYGAEGMIDFNNTQAMKDLDKALTNYLPIAQTFLVEWNALGREEGSNDIYFNLEYQSVEMRINGFNQMIAGIQNNDEQIFQAGYYLFQESATIGNQAEAEMIKIHNSCLAEP